MELQVSQALLIGIGAFRPKVPLPGPMSNAGSTSWRRSGAVL